MGTTFFSLQNSFFFALRSKIFLRSLRSSVYLLILVYELQKSPRVSGGPIHFSEVVEAQECLCNLKIVLYDFQKTLGVPEVPKHFCMTSKRLQECMEVPNNFLKL